MELANVIMPESDDYYCSDPQQWTRPAVTLPAFSPDQLRHRNSYHDYYESTESSDVPSVYGELSAMPRAAVYSPLVPINNAQPFDDSATDDSTVSPNRTQRFRPAARKQQPVQFAVDDSQQHDEYASGMELSQMARPNNNKNRNKPDRPSSRPVEDEPPPFQTVIETADGEQYAANSTSSDVRGWDVFRLLPPPADNLRRGFWMDAALQMLKLGTIVVVTLLVLLSAFVAKTSFLLMTSAIGWGGRNTTICRNPTIAAAANTTVALEHKHVVKWIWSVYLAMCVPQLFCFLKCLYRVLFKNVKKPSLVQFLIVFVVESLHAIGVGLFVFRLLPNLDAVTGAMLTSCLSFVPALLTLLSRKPEKVTVILVVFDILSIGAQSSGFWAWPVFFPELAHEALAVPAALTLISLGWWQNFVHTHSVFPFIRSLATLAANLQEKRSKTYVIVAPWKCVMYLLALFVFSSSRISVEQLMEPDPFGSKAITVYSWGVHDWNVQVHGNPQLFAPATNPPDWGRPTTGRPVQADWQAGPAPDEWPLPLPSPITHAPNDRTAATHPPWMTAQAQAGREADFVVDAKDFLNDQPIGGRTKREVISYGRGYVVQRFFTSPFDALWLLLLHSISVLLCYECSKFACKVMIQRLAFSLPVTLMVPITIVALIKFCGARALDACFFSSAGMPYELFWRCYPATSSLYAFVGSAQAWIWLTWFLSQTWVTIHLWRPQSERLASSDRLFVAPWFTAAFIDQSLALNRRRNDKDKVKTEDIELEEDMFYETIPAGGLTVGGTKSPPSVYSQSTTGERSNHDLIRNPAADNITKIYACATMWHESPKEMTCMLKSIFRLDEEQCARRNAQRYLKVVDPDYYEFEAHIFFDDAFDMNDYGEPVINKFVRQLLDKVDAAASAVHQTQMRLKSPRKFATPYGGRLVYILPGHNRLSIHLKDKARIRHRKRWSQVMYLYYLLGFRIMQGLEDQTRKEVITENTFILTLDGDVDFKPSCVHLLVDLMKKNRRLGAACGRIHPRGSGLMVWYQKFEYAIGHWFQKATEHMIGCVLCAPGCFSLFRSCALMDDNVARKYAGKSENAKDYIQYDQGEDRWLCTLLLQRGYRVEYCAASDALTFAPEGFNEFFNQRRRWIPSTLANVIDLISDYKNVVSVNDNISLWYIFYQLVMLLSSILGPGTIFLMTVGAISISFDVNNYVAFVTVLTPVIIFAVMCLTCSAEKQLMAAQVVGALFTLLMTAVIVGTALQIKKDGIYSPHAIFLFAVVGSFLVAAAMHPLESSCIIPMLLYFMAIPCMYMILPIYSVCNLNNVSWGTRENIKVDNNQLFLSNTKKRQRRNRHGGGGGHDDSDQEYHGETDGTLSLGCGTACRLMCCLAPSAIGDSPQMVRLTDTIKRIDEKIDRMDRRFLGRLEGGNGHPHNWADDRALLADDDDNMSDHDPHMDHIEPGKRAMVSETWLEDKALRRAERDYLDPDENSFWVDLIEKYLSPLRVTANDAERIKTGLSELRNKIAFLFFMMNALFILIVFLLQLKKDCLHIEWPLGPKVNRSFIPCDSMFNDETWEMTGLQLEPIGLVFLIFFMSILVVQFCAMVLHRLGTLAHIIASTELFCFRKSREKFSEEELVVANAVEIARELQAIRGVDLEGDQAEQAITDEHTISRRRVVQNLESSRRQDKRHRTETLDAAFRKRFFALNSQHSNESAAQTPILGGGRLTAKKSTIRALEDRRNSIFGTLDKKQGEQLGQQQQQQQHGNEQEDEDGLPMQPAPAARGPAQRRLERLFHAPPPRGEATTDDQAGDTTNAPSSSDEDSLRIPHPSSHRTGIRKLITQSGWPAEGAADSGSPVDRQPLANHNNNSPPTPVLGQPGQTQHAHSRF